MTEPLPTSPIKQESRTSDGGSAWQWAITIRPAGRTFMSAILEQIASITTITTAPFPTLRIELGDAPHALLRSDRSGRPDSGRVTGSLAALLRRSEGRGRCLPAPLFRRIIPAV